MKQSLLLPLAAAVFLALAGGCAQSVDLGTWRRGVEQYVRDKGGGDPAVLREIDVTPSHHGYRIISANRPSESTDAAGVLVGTTNVSDRPWVVFLVGLIDKQKVKDIRVAALSVKDNKYTWRMGGKDPKALDAYVKFNKGLAHRRFPDRHKEPVDYLGFPREEDRFEMSTQGDAIGVAHPPSGGKWHVTVNPPAKR
ncbi:MAG: hypothetical protein QOE14_2812 [Humisphaera sp.]|nr:hypothetical protein [Humisphaera sp.]